MSAIRKIIQEEIQNIFESGYKMWHPETMKGNPDKENRGEYTAAGDCDDDFFGVLLGYLGGDERSAKDFCKIATSSRPGDTLGLALKAFEIPQDMGFEIRQAHDHIFQVDTEDEESQRAPFTGWPDANEFQEGKRKMKITKSYLRKIIKEEREREKDPYERPLESPLGEDKVADERNSRRRKEDEFSGTRVAVIEYDEGGIIISDGWRPPTRLEFLPFNDIEGSEEEPKTADEIEKIILDFFKKNDVGSVRDEQMDVSDIEPKEWLDTMLMNHPAGSSRRPPEGSSGGHSIRNLDFINDLEGR